MPRIKAGQAVAVFLLLLIFCGREAVAQSASVATNHKAEKNDEGVIIREKTQVVTLNVSVTDVANKPVLGLTRENFEIYENKIKQTLEYFAATDVPVSIGIVFDISASMEAKLAPARSALKALVETSHPDDDFFLVTFNEKAQLVADFADGETIVQRLASVKTSGNTALYDAVFLGLEKLRQAKHKKQALIIISDGEDNCSRYSLRDISKYVKESEALIYCISISEIQSGNCGPTCQMFARRALEDIAGFTGGRTFFPHRLQDLEQATSQVALELRRQYSLGYVSTQPVPDGKWRKITTKIKADNANPATTQRVLVRAKEGYYAIP